MGSRFRVRVRGRVGVRVRVRVFGFGLDPDLHGDHPVLGADELEH